MKKAWRHPRFLILHAVLLAGAFLFPIYLRVASWWGRLFGECLFHRMFLYCPLCGGTRAITSLLHFDFVSAWSSNALVVVSCMVAIPLDVWAWVRYYQKKEPWPPLPKWSGIVLAGVLVGYFLLRNILMIFFGVDPTGDLGYFWDAMRTIRS